MRSLIAQLGTKLICYTFSVWLKCKGVVQYVLVLCFTYCIVTYFCIFIFFYLSMSCIFCVVLCSIISLDFIEFH